MAKLGFVLSVLYFSLASHGQAPPLPTVNLGYATYQGVSFQDNVSGDTNTQFLGIRYAAPPTGTLRFAAPQPPATTAGVQLADSQPNNCYSAGIGLATSSPYRATPLVSRETDETLEARAPPVASEDCLFLKYVILITLSIQLWLPSIQQNLTVDFSPVFSLLERWVVRLTSPSSSGFMGMYSMY